MLTQEGLLSNIGRFQKKKLDLRLQEEVDEDGKAIISQWW
jgi:hypothetical protein